MTDLPPEAVTAALDALKERSAMTGRGAEAARWHAIVALEAAAPHIAAPERKRACRIAANYLDGNVLREFADEVGCD